MTKGTEIERIKADDLRCNDLEKNQAVGWRDIVAIFIAQFQILMPIMLVAALVMSLLLFIIMKVWIRN
ncbi:hypothetical protein [Clostridium tagluense]|uniref:hypothetical protein n=1 Tax=Clostridium tagluense TaxID=360422 RepID=UPI001C0D0950|nr:hypothetical protein [Clostridium tagluense]MBU3129609.1 hypothetical protein [Clostridium tagluense]